MAHSGFWETMSILVDKDWKKLAIEDIQDWLDKILMRRDNYVIEDDDVSVIAKKRRLSTCSEYEIRGNEDIKRFLKGLRLPKIECKFSHPQTRSRLEKLMGSNLVSLTDRNYMQRLQERILEDYAESMDKRIKAREETPDIIQAIRKSINWKTGLKRRNKHKTERWETAKAFRQKYLQDSTNA